MIPSHPEGPVSKSAAPKESVEERGRFKEFPLPRARNLATLRVRTIATSRRSP